MKNNTNDSYSRVKTSLLAILSVLLIGGTGAFVLDRALQKKMKASAHRAIQKLDAKENSYNEIYNIRKMYLAERTLDKMDADTARNARLNTLLDHDAALLELTARHETLISAIERERDSLYNLINGAKRAR